MAKLPGFMFYPGDWLKEPSLKICSHAAKGVWIDMLCLMFECEERGVLATAGRAWTDDEIARAVGGDRDVTLSCLRELAENRVLRRTKFGAVYSERMVRDERVRQQAAQRQRRRRGMEAGHGYVTPDVTHGVTPVSQPISISSSDRNKNGAGASEGGNTGPPILEVEARDFIQKHPMLPTISPRMLRELCDLVKLKGWPYVESAVANEAGKVNDPIHEISERLKRKSRNGTARSAVAAKGREDR